MSEIVRSPSQTVTWARCPVMRELKYQTGLVPRRVGKKDIAAIAGRAFAKAMETYYQTKDEQFAEQQALSEIASGKQDIDSYGREVPDSEHAYYSAIEPRVKHSITKYIANDPLKEYKVIATELILPSGSRIDLLIEDDFGPFVIDFKYKLILKALYYDREVAKYKGDWQQFHYSWECGKVIERNLTRYGIVLVVGEPKFSAKLHMYPINPEAMNKWIESAERIWYQMGKEERGEAKPWMAPSHEDQYGPCEYKDACLKYHWDEELMKNDYVIIKREVK